MDNPALDGYGNLGNQGFNNENSGYEQMNFNKYQYNSKNQIEVSNGSSALNYLTERKIPNQYVSPQHNSSQFPSNAPPMNPLHNQFMEHNFHPNNHSSGNHQPLDQWNTNFYDHGSNSDQYAHQTNPHYPDHHPIEQFPTNEQLQRNSHGFEDRDYIPSPTMLPDFHTDYSNPYVPQNQINPNQQNPQFHYEGTIEFPNLQMNGNTPYPMNLHSQNQEPANIVNGEKPFTHWNDPQPILDQQLNNQQNHEINHLPQDPDFNSQGFNQFSNHWATGYGTPYEQTNDSIYTELHVPYTANTNVKFAHRNAKDSEVGSDSESVIDYLTKQGGLGVNIKKTKKKKPRGSSEKELVCSNCGATSTSVWRWNKDNERSCNSCAIYEQNCGMKRPKELWGKEIQARNLDKTQYPNGRRPRSKKNICSRCGVRCNSSYDPPICPRCRLYPPNSENPTCSTCNATGVKMKVYNKMTKNATCVKCYDRLNYRNRKERKEKLINGMSNEGLII